MRMSAIDDSRDVVQKVIEIDYGVNTTLLGASGFSFFLPREFKTPDKAK